MKKVKWALIGCGKVVLKNKTSPFINNKNEIVAICTTKLEHSIEAIKKLNLKNCHGYDDVFKMLKNESIDAIYICTPPKFHYEYLKTLSNYNIQLIYVEKPFVLNSEQAKSILNLYKNNLTKVFVAHYKRLTPQIKKLKQIIISKKYGEIEGIEGYFSRVYNQKLAQNSWIYKKEISGVMANTTNNIMELSAVIEALKLLKYPCNVSLYSDSAYVVNAFAQNWIRNWERNNWKTSDKKEVKNKELWQQLLELTRIHKVTFIKVKGHADNEFNNRCDELARKAINTL